MLFIPLLKRLLASAFVLLPGGLVHAQQMKVFSAKEFSISYPETWRVDTSGQYGAAVIFFSPLDSAGDKFDENVNVLTQDLKGQNINLSKYKSITENQVSNVATKSKLMKSVIEKTSGGERFIL